MCGGNIFHLLGFSAASLTVIVRGAPLFLDTADDGADDDDDDDDDDDARTSLVLVIGGLVDGAAQDKFNFSVGDSNDSHYYLLLIMPPPLAQLRRCSISVLIGDVPRADALECLAHAYEGSASFSQVVTLRSANLVQLCNFMKRCRLERLNPALAHRRYLVLLHFVPNRETLRLIEKQAELSLTLVIFGGPCAVRAVRDLVPMADYILEWHTKQIALRRLVLCLCDLRRQRTLAVVDVWTSAGVETTTAETTTTHTTLRHAFDDWARSNHYNETAFTSWDTSAPFASTTPASTQQQRNEQQQQQRHHHPASNGAITVAQACTLLSITEAQALNPDAVRSAYRTLARACHPDKNPSPEAAATFASISEAYTFLMSLFRRPTT
jgi:DnaJ domain